VTQAQSVLFLEQLRDWFLDRLGEAVDYTGSRRLSRWINGLRGGMAQPGQKWTTLDASLEVLLDNERLRAELAAHQATEMALRESEARFRDLADTAPVGIWVTDADQRVSFLNSTALAFAGRPIEELIGNNWKDLIHPDDRERVSSTYASAVARKGLFRTECRLRRADGQYRWLLNTGTPRFVNGVYVGHIGTISDTTDLKRNHEEMLAAQKLESLGALAAGIAHDFNNMLGAIFADSDLALMDVPPDTPVAASIERIKAVAVRASEIVKLLLIYAGGTDAAKEDVNLSAIVEEMIQLAQGSISAKAAVSTNLAKDLPLLRANPGQIRQVVLNLIMNASEALDGTGGSIAVTTERIHLNETTAHNYGSDLPDGDYARLTVRDTGCGILEEMRAKLFDPFYTTKFLGRGLGLAVVQGILRSHHGAVNVVSAPGTGSTFEVLLPCPPVRIKRGERASEESQPRSTTLVLSQGLT
jgi:two-component system, cell cycle sensor histidine kinase and response regulator CckA